MDPRSDIESAYQDAIAAMTPAERVARSAAMAVWARKQIARQIVAEEGEQDPEVLKLKVGLRLYGHEPEVRGFIERELANVSD